MVLNCLGGPFLVVVLWSMLPAVTPVEKTLCFCNSHACLQSVCKTEQQCYAGVIKAISSNDTRNSTWVRYGCEEELRVKSRFCPTKIRSGSTRTQVICCDGPDLCNMPNLLRAVILADEKTEDIPPSSISPHTSSNSINVATLKLVSVVMPSLLIIFVMLLSLGIMYKLKKFHEKQLETTRRIRTYFDKSYRPSTRVTLFNKKRTNSKNTNNAMVQNPQTPGELV